MDTECSRSDTGFDTDSGSDMGSGNKDSDTGKGFDIGYIHRFVMIAEERTSPDSTLAELCIYPSEHC